MPRHYQMVEPEAVAASMAAGGQLVHRYAGGRALVRQGSETSARSAPSAVDTDALLYVHGRPVEVPASVFQVGAGPRALLRFAGPIAASWVVALEEAGGVLHFFCSPFGLCASLSESALDRLRAAVPALLGARPYTGPHCARTTPRRPATPRCQALARAAGVSTDWLDVVCFEAADCERLKQTLQAEGVRVLSHSRYKLRVSGTHPGALREVVGVKLVGAARGAVLAQAELYAAVRHPEAARPALDARGLTGRGEVVAVADTGLDRGQSSGAALHADFRGRVRALQSWPLNAAFAQLARFPAANDGGADADSGHGTHVAGLVLGDGSASGGQIRGIAPGAELVFQALEQYTEVRPEHVARLASGHYLSGRPLDLRELFERARDDGARIHVNAWGDPANGHYTDDCYEADAFLAKNRDAVVLFAAGNAGADENGDGRVEPGSLYAPASAKNVLAVGATEGPRLGVGLRDGWRAFDPSGRRFRSAEVKSDPISGQPERLAMFSSAGPSADGRIKPDLCAPGTNLVSTRSQAGGARGWGLASPLPHYMYLGGTSMAVAVAGGAVAVLRGALREALGQAPSGAALKALLLYGCEPIIERDGSQRAPLARVGFGRLSLAAIMPGAGAPALLDEAVGVATAERFERRFELGARGRVRALLCWYDAAGERLINDLDLSLRDEQGVLAWGNHPDGGPGAPDRQNTVERVELELPAGRYVLRVDGFNVPTGRQPFALVCSVPLEASEPEPPAPAPLDVSPRATWAARLPLEALNGIGPHLAATFAEHGLRTLADFAARAWDEQPEKLRRLDAQRGRWQALWNALQAPPPHPASWLAAVRAGLDRAWLARLTLTDLD